MLITDCELWMPHCGVRPTQRLRDLDDRVFRARTSKPFTVPCRYGYLSWQRWGCAVVAIIWIGTAGLSRSPLQIAVAGLWGIATLVTLTTSAG
jgi:hypothetical protein